VALLMFALGLYFVTYCYSEGVQGNTLQVIAGAGLATVAFVASLATVWQRRARSHTPMQQL
jgi:hypothetical protein